MTDIIDATRKMKEHIEKLGGRDVPRRWIIGQDMALKLRRELAMFERNPTRRKHPGLLFKLHGLPITIDGPPDEIRLVREEDLQ